MKSKGKIIFEGDNGHVVTMTLTPTGNETEPFWDVEVDMGEKPEDADMAPVHIGLAVENIMMMKMSSAFNVELPEGMEIQMVAKEDPDATVNIFGGPQGEA